VLPLRSAAKSLRRSPGFATVSILSLALALGLVAAVFGLVDGLRHPITATFEPEHLYRVALRGEGAAGRITAADHIDVLEQFVRSRGQIAYFVPGRGDAVNAGNIRMQAYGNRVSANYFAVRGVKPIAGRTFGDATADEDYATSIILSERLWMALFDGDRRLDRLAVTLEDMGGTQRLQVVGVMPEALAAETNASYWLSLPSNVRSFFATQRSVGPLIRLRDGATIDSLNADFKLATNYLTQLHGTGRIEFAYYAYPQAQDPTELNSMTLLLLGAAIAVLIVACSNLANLVFARGLARQHELAVRLSLGATRRHIISGVLAECLIIALAGAALGILAAWWGWSIMRGVMPERLPNGVLAITLNWRIVAMSTTAAAASALLFGLLPALRLSDLQLASHIKDNAGTTTARHRGRFPVLVIGQVALSLAMLTCVTLLLRASQAVRAVDFGFNPGRLLSVQVYARSSEDTSQAARLAMSAAAGKRLRDIPKVEAVAWANGIDISRAPTFTGERSGGAVRWRPMKGYWYVSPNYLATRGVPVIKGRDFNESDALGEGVLIVDSVTALRIWGSEDPIGKLAKFGPPERIQPWFRVVGVSRSVRSSLPAHAGEEIAPQVYMAGKAAFTSPIGPGLKPLRQYVPSRSFVVRAEERDIPALRLEIMRQLRQVVPRGGILVNGFDESRRQMLARQKLLAQIFGTFGLLSLALCALGLYSVLSYSVSRRMREHGIRVALGASSKDIFRDVLHEGALLVIAGTAVGGFVTFFSNRFVDPYIGLLYHIDALALAAAEFVLIGVALAAMTRPALRATKTDPVAVLRAT
jgi:putative ABC transport system permease protein